MAKYDVRLLQSAYSDLDEIFDYILTDNPLAAERTLDNIMSSLHRLEDYPESGAPLTIRSLRKYDFRIVVICSYIAFYRFIDDKVLVYRILHGARNYRRLLKNTIEDSW